jgi:hypothetical protein
MYSGSTCIRRLSDQSSMPTMQDTPTYFFFYKSENDWVGRVYGLMDDLQNIYARTYAALIFHNNYRKYFIVFIIQYFVIFNFIVLQQRKFPNLRYSVVLWCMQYCNLPSLACNSCGWSEWLRDASTYSQTEVLWPRVLDNVCMHRHALLHVHRLRIYMHACMGGAGMRGIAQAYALPCKPKI